MYRCLFRSLPVLMLLTVLSLVPALSGDACREMTSLVGPTCALADEAPQKNDDKADAKKDDKAQDKKSRFQRPCRSRCGSHGGPAGGHLGRPEGHAGRHQQQYARPGA